MKRPIGIKLDGDAERVRRSHETAITELQQVPVLISLGDVVFVANADTPISHKLGRKPNMFMVSPPRAATSAASLAVGPGSTGRIVEVRSGTYDATQVLVLRAVGWGETITALVAVL